MKNFKRYLIITICICMLTILSSCTTKPTPTPSPSPTATVSTPTPSPKTYINAQTTGFTEDGWSKIDSYSFDIDGDGTEEIIQLTTSAAKDSKGRILWDDSQKWVVEVLDGEDIYTLMPADLVSNGGVYFEFYQNSEITKNCIRILISSSAGFSVKEYEYVKDKKAFTEAEPIKVQNLLYSSIPNYE